MKYKSRTEFVILKLKNKSKERKILDIGFIGEYNTPFIHNAILNNYPEDYVVGIDISDKINIFKNSKNSEYLQLSIFDIDKIKKFKNFFDIITFCETFEHLPNPYLSLEKINYCLKQNGKLLMTYPNPLSIKKFIHYLFQKNLLKKKFLKKYLGAIDHKVFPMPTSIIAYLNYIGFEVEEIAFLKGKLSKIPILNKFSSYIGVIAKKL